MGRLNWMLSRWPNSCRLLCKGCRTGCGVLAYCLMANQPASPRLCRPKRSPDRHPNRRAVIGPGQGLRADELSVRPSRQPPARPQRAAAFAQGYGRPSLWQSRFYSCSLGSSHFWRAMQYVERNPVRAKQVRRAWRYPWSSAAAHCGKSWNIGGTCKYTCKPTGQNKCPCGCLRMLRVSAAGKGAGIAGADVKKSEWEFIKDKKKG